MVKEGLTGEIHPKATGKLELTINNVDCPSDTKIKEIVDKIVKVYGNIKFTTSTIPVSRLYCVKFVIEAVTSPAGEPVMAALESFSHSLGNIEVYERVIKYSLA